MEYSVQDIKELMEALKANKLSGLKVKSGDFELELKGGMAYAAITNDEASPAAAHEHKGHVVTSPIVGTFYSSPSPEREPYVKIGSRVNKGDVLFIIESMKLMNEVTSDVSGMVTEVLVNDAQGVEYGQPILCINESE